MRHLPILPIYLLSTIITATISYYGRYFELCLIPLQNNKDAPSLHCSCLCIWSYYILLLYFDSVRKQDNTHAIVRPWRPTMMYNFIVNNLHGCVYALNEYYYNSSWSPMKSSNIIHTRMCKTARIKQYLTNEGIRQSTLSFRFRYFIFLAPPPIFPFKIFICVLRQNDVCVRESSSVTCRTRNRWQIIITPSSSK